MRWLLTYAALCLFTANWTLGQVKGQQPLKVPANTMAARLLTAVKPQPPDKPMMKCSDAMVYVDVVIGPDGKVSSAKVVSGWEEFRKSAINAVKHWTYKPYLENGSPISVETEVMILYTSSGSAGPLFVPDGKGGIKGGTFAPLPPICGKPTVKTTSQ